MPSLIMNALRGNVVLQEFTIGRLPGLAPETAHRGEKNGEKNAVLCYDKKKRSKASVLRIETYDVKGFEKARDAMAKKSEGAHFLIRQSGSIYQVLDLAYTTRRDGALRPDEIRVLSAFPEKEELLYQELKHYMPALTLDRHRVTPEASTGTDSPKEAKEPGKQDSESPKEAK